jgi:hypothetical protein
MDRFLFLKNTNEELRLEQSQLPSAQILPLNIPKQCLMQWPLFVRFVHKSQGRYRPVYTRFHGYSVRWKIPRRIPSIGRLR